MRISYSSLDTFLKCPLKYKYQYMDRIRTPKSKEAVFGTLLHNSLKFLYQNDPVFPTVKEVVNYYKKHWPAKDKFKWSHKTEEESYYNEGLRMLEDYLKKNMPIKQSVIALETPFSIPLKDNINKETHILTGKVDRIDKIADRTFEIIDYKTAKRMPSQNDIDNDLQLSIYEMGFKQRWPKLKKPNISLSLYFLKHGQKMTTQRTASDAKKTKETIFHTVSLIKQGDFKPTPSKLCDWCGYKSTCPMWRHLFVNEVKTEKEIKKMISEYFRLKRKADSASKKMGEIRKSLSEFLDKKGLNRVFGAKGYATKKEQTKYAYDGKELKKILKPLGKWNDVININQQKLSSIIASLPLEDQIKIKQIRKIQKKFEVIHITKKPL